jgi:hypothetical protein
VYENKTTYASYATMLMISNGLSENGGKGKAVAAQTAFRKG